jgi:hypothetical protein
MLLSLFCEVGREGTLPKSFYKTGTTLIKKNKTDKDTKK